MTRDAVRPAVRLPRTRRRPTLASPREGVRPRRVGLIVHSLAANPGRIVETARRVTEAIGAQLSVEFTSLAEPGRSQTVRLCRLGVDSLVVAGGDGTVRQAVRELMDGPVPLGIVPVGSGNVLAAALGLSPGRLATNTPLVPGAHLVRGGVVLAGDARMDDGLLDVVAVAPHRPDEWIGIAAKGLLGSDAKAPGLQYDQGTSVQVHSARPVAVQADGDIVSTDCVDFSARVAGRVSLRVA